jgi:hypothetical protein
MSQAKTSTEVLKAVEWILENVGWSQSANFRDKDGQTIGSCVSQRLDPEQAHKLGSVCLNGALLLVETTRENYDAARARLIKALPNHLRTVMGFNDNEKTTKDKVLKVVRKAIKETK